MTETVHNHKGVVAAVLHRQAWQAILAAYANAQWKLNHG